MNPLPLVLETTALPNELFSLEYMNINYLLEIKNRFLLSLISWLCCLFINFYHHNNLIYILIKPCLYSYKETTFYFVYNSLSEPFYTNIQNVVLFSNQVFFLFLVYHLFNFLSPGLYENEYSKLKFVLKFGLTILWVSCVICYKYVIPCTWKFFFDYQNSQKITFYFEAKFNEYIELIYVTYKIILLFTLISIMLLTFLILKKNIKNFLINNRKTIYLSIVIIASTVTPPDIFSQIVLIFGLVNGFEIIIYAFMQCKIYTK